MVELLGGEQCSEVLRAGLTLCEDFLEYEGAQLSWKVEEMKSFMGNWSGSIDREWL